MLGVFRLIFYCFLVYFWGKRTTSVRATQSLYSTPESTLLEGYIMLDIRFVKLNGHVADKKFGLDGAMSVKITDPAAIGVLASSVAAVFAAAKGIQVPSAVVPTIPTANIPTVGADGLPVSPETVTDTALGATELADNVTVDDFGNGIIQ